MSVAQFALRCEADLRALQRRRPCNERFGGRAGRLHVRRRGHFTVAQLRAGTIKVYAIGTSDRNPVLPNVPTSKEAGLAEFQADAWNALFAPKATPKPILDKLTETLDKALDDENTRKRLLEFGSSIPDKAKRGQQALALLVKSEIARLTPIIKAANIKGE
jgi:tripartite-type tricarboxylate transporter receptor subunit TctC